LGIIENIEKPSILKLRSRKWGKEIDPSQSIIKILLTYDPLED
jgi:hypothetical protein